MMVGDLHSAICRSSWTNWYQFYWCRALCAQRRFTETCDCGSCPESAPVFQGHPPANTDRALDAGAGLGSARCRPV